MQILYTDIEGRIEARLEKMKKKSNINYFYFNFYHPLTSNIDRNIATIGSRSGATVHDDPALAFYIGCQMQPYPSHAMLFENPITLQLCLQIAFGNSEQFCPY